LVNEYNSTNQTILNISLQFIVVIICLQLSILSPVEIKLASLIGVTEGYITKKASGRHTKQVTKLLNTVKPVYKVNLRDWPQSSLYRQVDFISRVIFVEE